MRTADDKPPYGFSAAMLLLGAAAMPLAHAEDSEPMHALEEESIDAVDYFLRQSLSREHPFHTSAGQAEHGGESPLTIWAGPRESILRGTLKAETAYFDQSDSWFGASEFNLGAESESWWEVVVHPGVAGSYFMENGSELYGRFSFVHASTDDLDAAGSDFPNEDPSHTSVENAYVGWKSGEMWPSLGKDFLELSFGMQPYQAGTGFIFYDQSSNGGSRGGYWIGERNSAEYTGIVTVNYNKLSVDATYFKADDNPDTDTRVGGVTIDYDLGDLGSVGGGYYNVESDILSRDGMDVFNIRTLTTPFAAFDTPEWMHPIKLDGEFVNEDNGDELEASGWYVATGYDWEDVTWSPGLTYRYASFGGDDPDSSMSEDFDPLFYGFSDWGYWFQGEILGEYVLLNSNLNSHMVRANFSPTNDIHVNVFYFHFELDDAAGFGVSDDSFADEWNITVDWTVTDTFALSLVGGYADPDDGAEEFTGGGDDWSYVMLYATYSFK